MKPFPQLKIISGGQTGVDRAALDAALKHGIACGGWCPAGRLDEFGRIPDRYPVKELELSNKEGRSPDRPGDVETAAPWENRDVFAARTLQNVKDSDGTVVFYFGELCGGSAETIRFCLEQKRVHKSINAAEFSVERTAEAISEFVRANEIGTLNVAGPRQTEWPGGYDYAFRTLDIFLGT
jgi:Circularly permutated YpsA SLOG family